MPVSASGMAGKEAVKFALFWLLPGENLDIFRNVLQEMNQMRDIFRGKGEFKNVVNNDNVFFLEKKLYDGRGIRLQKDYKFKGFID